MGLGANNQGGSGLFVETVAEQLGTKCGRFIINTVSYYSSSLP